MPLVQLNNLPTYQRLRQEGHHILTPERAAQQDIRSLHVGLLNMMPDAAIAATERQFFRLIGSSNPISQFCLHPFTVPEIPRSKAAAEHIEKYYDPLETVLEQGLDALIITGANVLEADLTKEVFWEPLNEVFNWAQQNVTSTLCSCLATHAVLRSQFDIKRIGLPKKCWGVYDHKVMLRDHPLVHDINTTITVPQSRFNEITKEQFEEHGLHVLAHNDESGVQLAVSPDGFRTVYFQGHPEYDHVSLMKEYKRDIGLFIDGKLDDYPPMPHNYFDNYSAVLLDEYKQMVISAKESNSKAPHFPEPHLIPRLENTWHDSGESVVGNWIGLVYQITNSDRRLPYMESIDPSDPLGWLAKSTK